jgi:archaeoflavoprotein AfpA
MALKVAWGITGSGDLITETVQVMSDLSNEDDFEITAVVSVAGEKVLRWYKLWDAVEALAKRVFVEKDANTPFIVGPLQIGHYDCFVVAPLTANSTAKIAHGIADTLITNAVAQTAKSDVPIYLLPVDQREGKTVTTRPGGEKLELMIRPIDIANARALATMRGLHVLAHPGQIADVLHERLLRRREQS